MPPYAPPLFSGGPLNGRRIVPNGQGFHVAQWERPNRLCPCEKRRAVYVYDAGTGGYRFDRWEDSPMCFKCGEKRKLGMVTR